MSASIIVRYLPHHPSIRPSIDPQTSFNPIRRGTSLKLRSSAYAHLLASSVLFSLPLDSIYPSSSSERTQSLSNHLGWLRARSRPALGCMVPMDVRPPLVSTVS
jgi:hypothetical protein